MLLDLIEKLVDRCIGLVREQKEAKRHFLQDFVDPIYSEFQSLHDGYLASFKESGGHWNPARNRILW